MVAGRQRWAWRIVSLVAGAIPLLAFPEVDAWWLAWIALVPWVLVVRAAPTASEAGVRSWAAGVGFVVALHWWLASYLGPFAVPLALAFGLLWLPWGWAAWRLLRDPPTGGRVAAALVVLPSGWVVIDLVRSWEHLGGPWGVLGASQWNQPATLAPAAVGGVWLVSSLVVAVNVGIAAAIAGSGAARLVAGGVAIAALGVGPVWHTGRADPAATGPARVAIVQSGLGAGHADRLEAAVAATRLIARDRLDLVVWGESSVGFDLERRADVRDRLVGLAGEVDADLLVNVDTDRKTAVLVTADGIRGRYHKMRLVPFGEYVPFRPLLGWTTSLGAARDDYRRGDRLTVLGTAGARVGPLVSFELGFADMSRNLAERGAEAIVVQSMTSSFQGTWAPEQHASRAAVRAVETGRPVVHAALTGVSAAFDARGRRLAWLGTGERGTAIVGLPLASERTPYDRLGDWVPGGSVLVTLAALAIRWRQRRRPAMWPSKMARSTGRTATASPTRITSGTRSRSSK